MAAPKRGTIYASKFSSTIGRVGDLYPMYKAGRSPSQQLGGITGEEWMRNAYNDPKQGMEFFAYILQLFHKEMYTSTTSATAYYKKIPYLTVDDKDATYPNMFSWFLSTINITKTRIAEKIVLAQKEVFVFSRLTNTQTAVAEMDDPTWSGWATGDPASKYKSTEVTQGDKFPNRFVGLGGTGGNAGGYSWVIYGIDDDQDIKNMTDSVTNWEGLVPSATNITTQFNKYIVNDGGSVVKVLAGGLSNASRYDPVKQKAKYTKIVNENDESIREAGIGYTGGGKITDSNPHVDMMYEIDVLSSYNTMHALLGLSGYSLDDKNNEFSKNFSSTSTHGAGGTSWCLFEYGIDDPMEMAEGIDKFIKSAFILGGICGAGATILKDSYSYSTGATKGPKTKSGELTRYYNRKLTEHNLKFTKFQVPIEARLGPYRHAQPSTAKQQKFIFDEMKEHYGFANTYEGIFFLGVGSLLNEVFVLSEKAFDDAKKGDKKGQGLVDKLSAINKARGDAFKDLAGRFVPYEGTSPAKEKAKKDELNRSIMQCVLLAGFTHLEKISIGMRNNTDGKGNYIKKKIKGTNIALGTTKPYPWGGRIIPVGVKPYQNTMNALTIPLLDNVYGIGLNDYLKSPEPLASGYRTTVRVSKVVKNYKDLSGKLINEGNVVKLPLIFGMAETTTDPDGKEDFLLNNFYSPPDLKLIGEKNGLITDNAILIKSIDVSFKGGNMATSKSDVEVKMSFVLPDINTIKQYFKGEITIGKKTHKYKYSFLDLITYTNQSSPTGFASVFRNQYHPDYNRLLLESHVFYEKPLQTNSMPKNANKMASALEQVPLVLDIAVVDHEIKKNDKTLQAEVTVSYRGYVHSALSDPSYDSLAGPDLLDRRVNKEIQMQQKLEQGCSLDTLRSSIREFNEDTKMDSVFVIPRIIDQLQSSNRLFKVSVKKSAIRGSLNAYADSIKFPKRIKDSIESNIDLKKVMEAWHFYKEMDASKKTAAERAKLINANYPSSNNRFFSNGVDFGKKFEDWYEMSGKSKGSTTVVYKDAKKAISKKTILDQDYEGIEFFFLGDLIDILLDSVHLSPIHIKNGIKEIAKNRNIRTKVDLPFQIAKSRVNKLKEGYYFKPDPIKVILSSFEWFEWNDRKNKFESQYSNLADVPISLSWFADWFGEEIIKKKLSYYPIVSFIRKLAQTVVTRLLGEVCFEVGSDKRVLFRAISNFGLIADNADTINRYKRKNTTQLVEDYYEWIKSSKGRGAQDKGTYIIDYMKNRRMKKIPLIKKNNKKIDFNTSQKDYYTNYIVMYPANASSFEYMTQEGANQWLRAGIPEFKQLTKVTQFFKNGTHATIPEAMIESMSFTKKDAPYRREVKFFASNQGNIAQIAGVYNVKIKLSNAAYFLYPGQVCWVDGGLGQDPSSPKTLAFQLGIGGYYQIITVNHSMKYFGGQSPKAKTEIEASWIGYGIKKSLSKAAFFRTGAGYNNAKAARCNSSLPTRNVKPNINYSSEKYRQNIALGKPPPVINVPTASPTTTTTTGKKTKVTPAVAVGDPKVGKFLNPPKEYIRAFGASKGEYYTPDVQWMVTQVDIVDATITIEGRPAYSAKIRGEWIGKDQQTLNGSGKYLTKWSVGKHVGTKAHLEADVRRTERAHAEAYYDTNGKLLAIVQIGGIYHNMNYDMLIDTAGISDTEWNELPVAVPSYIPKMVGM